MRPILLLPLLIPLCALTRQTPPAPEVSADDLIRKVVAHDLEVAQQDHTHWSYRSIAKIPAPEKSKTVVEAEDCDVTLLTAIGGRPLNAEEKAAEDKRLRNFLADPGQQQKARRAGDADKKKSVELLAMLPDAFLFQYAQTDGKLVKLRFTPNPRFVSHSSEGYVMHKMEGFVLVNAAEDRLAEISGHLMQKVEFGGGLLGHLDAGGSFDVRRTEVAPDHWAITRVKVNMNGRILFFKTIAEKQDETDSDFEEIPDTTTVAEAETMARSQPLSGIKSSQ